MINNELVKKAQFGDQEAVTQIFTKYKNFVLSKSRNYFLNGADREDLLQEGMIGLLKAIRAYDDGKNASFTTFASLCIKRHIITAIKNSNSGKNRVLNMAVSGYFEGEDENVAYGNYKSLHFYNPEELYITKEKLQALKKYLDKNLSNFEKEIFIQMVKGHSYTEIATDMDRKVKSVDNAIQRIKKKVKRYLGEC